jgi:hypothetical protein
MDKMKREFKNLFAMQIVNLRNQAKKSFELTLSSICLNSILTDFDATVVKYKIQVSEFFEDHVKEFMYPGEKWEYDLSYKEDMDKFAAEIRLVQINKTLEKEKELLELEMGHSIGACLDTPGKELWSLLRMNYASSLEKQLAHLDGVFKGMALSPEEKVEQNRIIREKAEAIIATKLNDYVNFLSLKMHKKFDEEFRYDSGHIPRIFKNAREIKDSFMKARNAALTLLDLFFINRSTDSRLDYVHLLLPNGVDEEISFSYPKVDSKYVIKKESECRRLYEEFVFQIESSYADAQKSMLLHTQQGSIPIWVWVLLLVLGYSHVKEYIFNPFVWVLLIAGFTLFFSSGNVYREKLREFLRGYPTAMLVISMVQEKLGFNLFEPEERKVEKPREVRKIVREPEPKEE